METYDEYALDELIHQYMDDEIELDEIVEFCDNLEPSIKNKKMLYIFAGTIGICAFCSSCSNDSAKCRLRNTSGRCITLGFKSFTAYVSCAVSILYILCI